MFCVQCGNPVQASDRFCAKCGHQQGEPATIGTDPLASVNPRLISVLCYLPFVGVLACLLVLVAPQFRQQRETRFHAFQGLYLFVLWMVLGTIDGALRSLKLTVSHAGWDNVWHPDHLLPFPLGAMVGIMKVVVLVSWIVMMRKTRRGKLCRLPVLGDLAERSVAEQM